MTFSDKVRLTQKEVNNFQCCRQTENYKCRRQSLDTNLCEFSQDLAQKASISCPSQSLLQRQRQKYVEEVLKFEPPTLSEKNKQYFSDGKYQNQTKNNSMFDSQNTTQENKKTFVFENQDTCQSVVVEQKISPKQGHTDLRPILHNHCPIDSCEIEMFNTFLSKFVTIDKFNDKEVGLIPNEYLEYGFIMIRFRNLNREQAGFQEENSGGESSQISVNKKDRSKERTIGEVIELVKRWRNLHEGKEGKKFNLQEAAKIVGISKKSLDDYYYQLRLGEQYEYQFHENLNQKIGSLRLFVKSHKKPENNPKSRNIKHPKKLKIIENFQSRGEPHQSQRIEEPESKEEAPDFFPSPILKSFDSHNDRFFNESASMSERDFADVKNTYYQNFNEYLDREDDPFFFTGDFKKKPSQTWNLDSSEILF